MSITTLLSLVGDIVSLGGAFKRLSTNPEKSDVKKYITFLEQRRVLYAQFDQEIKHAVIKSIEDIKHETETLRCNIKESTIRKSLGKLIKVMSNELDNLWAYDTIHRKGQIKMFMSIQRFRTEVAKNLAMLCYAYGIDPKSTELQQFIVNMATVRPTTNVSQ